MFDSENYKAVFTKTQGDSTTSSKGKSMETTPPLNDSWLVVSNEVALNVAQKSSETLKRWLKNRWKIIDQIIEEIVEKTIKNIIRKIFEKIGENNLDS